MRVLRTAFLAGIAALGIGLAATASAQTQNTMTVRLPTGGLAEIRYVGDVPPQVVFLPARTASSDRWAPVASLFGPDSPFALIERISAEMDLRAEAMFRHAAAAARQAGTASPGYTHVAAAPGSGFCMQGVRITQMGGGAPQVESYRAGDCGPGAAAAGGAARMPVGPLVPSREPQLLYTQSPAPVTQDPMAIRPAAPAAPAKQPDLILTQNSGVAPYAGMVRHVANAAR